MREERKKETVEFKLIESAIDYMPLNVRLADLKENGKLLTDEQNALALKLPPGKHKKGGDGLKNFPFSILVATPSLKNPEAQPKKTYVVYKKLGGGGYGKVRLGLEIDPDHTQPAKWVAIKLQTERFNSKEDFERTQSSAVLVDAKHEFNILSRVNQKDADYTAGQIQREKKPKERKTATDDKKAESTFYYHQHIMIMPLAQGMELTRLPITRMSTAERLNICKNVLHAARAMHHDEFLHCDIKPQNIIINVRTGEAKLVDVGLVKKGIINNGKLEAKDEPAGSPQYMAPEILEECGKAHPEDMSDVIYSEKTEVYSLGMSLAEVLRLAKPTVTPPEKLAKIENPDFRPYLAKELTLIDQKSDDYKNHPSLHDETSRNEIYKLLERMTHIDPEQRPSIDDAINVISRVHKQYLQTPACLRKSVILSLDDLQQMSDEDKNEQYAELRKYNEIVFVSNSPRKRDDLEVMKLSAELETKGIIVHPTIYSPDSKGVSLNDISDRIIKKLDKDPNIARHYEILNLKEVKEIKEKSIQLDKIITLLENDISRLQDKYKGKNQIIGRRIEAINAEIKVLEGQPKIGYEQMLERLDSLQNKMFNSSFIKGRLFSNTKSSHSSKEIEKVKFEIKQKLGRP